jgi:23S rRNA pseudouridine1911/1915/1917 synthase
MSERIQHNITLPDELVGLRLDQALTKVLPQYSRTQIQEWIKTQQITLDGKPAKTKDVIIGGETVEIDAARKEQPAWQAQDIKLDVIYEDDDLLVINKPAGMVVHPGTGNSNNTLLNALLYHAPILQTLPRAGIIHRLDKDTTGLLVIAKTPAAMSDLSAQLKNRTIKRIYQTVVMGLLTSGGTVDAPIARHPLQRKRMAVMDNGKDAVTHYRVMERYRGHTRLKVMLETGRTHQIRVHMAHKHQAVLGDPVYGGRLQLPKGASADLITALRGFKRQALHAYELELVHPATQQTMRWRAPLPADMQQLIDVLRNDTPKADDSDYDDWK